MNIYDTHAGFVLEIMLNTIHTYLVTRNFFLTRKAKFQLWGFQVRGLGCGWRVQKLALSIFSFCACVIPRKTRSRKQKNQKHRSKKFAKCSYSHYVNMGNDKTWKSIFSLISTITKFEWSKGLYATACNLVARNTTLDVHLRYQISLDISNIWVTQLCIQDAKSTVSKIKN